MAGRADHAGLHIVDVGVDESGDDQAVRVARHFGVGRDAPAQGVVGADRLDHAVAADDHAVALMDQRRSRVGQEGIVAQIDEAAAKDGQ